MVFFEDEVLAASLRGVEGEVLGVAEGERRVVEEVGAEDAVFRGELVVDADGEEVFGGDLLADEVVLGDVARGGGVLVGDGKEADVLLHGGVCDPGAGSVREDVGGGGVGEVLADGFEVAEEEGVLLPDGAARGGAVLVAAERRRRGSGVEVVSGVERAVAEEAVCRAVDPVGSAARDGVDDAAGGLAVLGGEVAGEDGELGDGVYAEVDADDGAGTAVGVVVDADAVEAVVVLRGPSSGDGDLGAEAAVAAACALVEGDLGGDAGDAGLQGGEIGPTAAVEGKIADDRTGDDSSEGGRGEFDGRRGIDYLDPLIDRADAESEGEGEDVADLEGKARGHGCKAGSDNGDVVVAGKQVWSGINAILIA